MTERCERYGISRTAGYKWVARVEEGCRAVLADRSRAPHHCPHRIPDAMAELLCTTRRKHPLWGPKKLLQNLSPRHRRIIAWPAVSTVGDLLVRHGLVTKRRRRLLFLATPLEGYDVELDEVDNGIWSIYFCNNLIARFDERKYVIRSSPAAPRSVHHVPGLLCQQSPRLLTGARYSRAVCNWPPSRSSYASTHSVVSHSYPGTHPVERSRNAAPLAARDP